MASTKTIWVIAVVLSVASSPVLAIVDFRDGQIHDIDYEIDDCVYVDYQCPGMKTTVNLLGGGNIRDYIRGYEDSQMNILGGSIGLDVQAHDSSTIDMSGGSIGSSMWIGGRTQVNILGGSIGRDVAARDSSQVRMSGGSIGWSIWFYGSNEADISGGSIGNGMWVAGSSQVHISGGSIGQQLPGYTGQGEVRILTVVYGLEAYDSSEVEISGGSINGKLALDDSAIITIHGGDFVVDGEAFGYGELASITGGYWRSEPRRHLTGRLASGEPIDNDFYIGNEARIVLVHHTIRPPILLYVDDNAPNDPGPGDPAISDPCENGSMEHPYDAIQEAIDMAYYSRDIVLVADGTYTGDGNRDIDFLGKAITVKSENGPETCIIDCQASFRDPHRGFYFHRGENVNSVVEGFTITNGNVEGLYPDDNGGGIYCVSASPTIASNIIIHNNAEMGGGICCISSLRPLRIVSNTISANTADDVGAVYCVESKPLIINNVITSNIGWTEKGGLLFTRCPSGMIVNNVIAGNLGEDGAGGGIILYNSSLTIANCTITDNEGYYGGQSGIWLMDSSSAVVTNSIVWGNYKDQISCYQSSYAQVRYSNVEGGYEGIGNIDVNPCFVNPGYWEWCPLRWVDGDYHLRADSLCINAGDPNYVAEPNETDLDGKPRVIGGRIDIGAYEYSPPVPAEARIVPRTINLASKGKWITCYIWLPEDCEVADIDPNSILLEGEIQAELFRVDEQQQVAIARFSRSEVQGILAPGEVELTVSGELTDGTRFEGTDTIRVIDKGEKK